MSLKEFFKPTTGKIILTAILFIIFGFLFQTATDVRMYGLPFLYYEKTIIPCPPSVPNCNDNIYFNIFYLFLDLIIWYLISCLIIHIYYNLKRISKNE